MKESIGNRLSPAASLVKACLAGLLVLGCVLGCRTFAVESQRDVNTNFADYHTFTFSAIDSPPPDGFRAGHLLNSIMRRRIRDELRKGLTARGFVEAAPEQAQFIISFSGGSAERITSAEPATDEPDTQTIAGSATVVRHGALVVHFVDTKTQLPIWRGWVLAVMQPDDDLDEKVRSAVRAILKEFPPHS